jgi:molecular chaperone GrpE (heat shock protein)
MEIAELEEKLSELLDRFERLNADLEDLKTEKKRTNEKLLVIQQRLEGLLDRLSLMK